MSERKRGIAIGLTGNIGSGKTTVMNLFAKLGCRTLSTDEIAHELLEYDPVVKKKILDSFGDAITNSHGKVDRSKLANIVFNDKKKRIELENILHPEIKKAAAREIDNLPEGSVMVIEAPLLFESGWEKKVDYQIVVTCPEEIRRKRYCTTDKRELEDFERRDKSQWDEDSKSQRSTFTIDNSKDLTKTISQVTNVLKRLRQMMMER